MIIGSNILFFENLPSTNVFASNLLKTSEVPEGTIIRASFQSAGRGQMGNNWESESGKNLLISVILYPAVIKPHDQFLISMTISLAISDFIGRYISGVRIKWPNDVYVNNDKIAGILIENSIMGDSIINSVAGIGLNINQRKFVSDAPNPVSLSILTGKEHNLDVCLTELSNALEKRYLQLRDGKKHEIRKDYISGLYRLNEWHEYIDSGSKFMARIINVDENGMLHMECRDKTIREYSFKEVDFIL
jgi:BirA family transcriptional regulator, biotin operon repressor / biotin---[acetyl-CoA-carboxylase] ligase